jgi:hypothetical protein
MRFDDNEIQELAAFFSRRFPNDAQRRTMASAAGLTQSPEDWTSLLLAAQSEGRLPRLAAATVAAAPGDDNLRDVCHILTAPRRRMQSIVAVSSAVVLALALVVGFAWSRPAPDAEPVQPAAVLASAEADPPPAAPIAEPVAAALKAAPVAQPAEEPVAEPIEEPEPVAEPEESREHAAPASATLTGRCQATKGELIGYWYAGETRPGQAGATIEIPMGANVRADYPDEHNRFNARASVRCVLRRGDRLVLSADPIRVPGERYWVPLHGGDLL